MAFTRKLNIDGWRIEGIIPFTRQALWRRRDELAYQKKKYFTLSTSSSRTGIVSLPYTSSSSYVVAASHVGHIAPSGSVVPAIVHVSNH
jgi:hypothetical protein